MSQLLPVMLERLLLLSLRYSRADVVFEAPAALGRALLRRAAPLQVGRRRVDWCHGAGARRARRKRGGERQS